MNRRIEKKKLLIVEGRDEENFFQAVFNRHLHRNDVQVLGVGGKTKLTENLRVLVNDAAFPDVEALGIVRDADETPVGSSIVAAQSALESVKYSLENAGLPTSALHSEFAVGTPRIGVFVVPDGLQDGMLETLCVSSIMNHPEYACIEENASARRLRPAIGLLNHPRSSLCGIFFVASECVIGHPATGAGTGR
jgi:hypothetical protein